MKSSTGIRMRAAQRADLDSIQRLTHATTMHSYAPFLGEESVRAFLDSGEAERVVQEHLATAWVIEDDEGLAGVAVAEGAVIGQLMIDHHRHRRGLGSQLLDYVETRLFAHHATLELHSFAANEVANGFYRATGWSEAQRRPDSDTGIDMIVFRKRRGNATADARTGTAG